MNWQYRTILFEYHKDGLLGDKYIDDEQVEKVLNEQGDEGWELVAVTPVQEGLLSFFKRVQPSAPKMTGPVEQHTDQPPPAKIGTGKPAQVPLPEPGPEKAPAGDGKGGVGEIKIS